MNQPNQTRKFSGQDYDLREFRRDKRDASAVGRSYRTMGYNARVVRRKGGWAVYVSPTQVRAVRGMLVPRGKKGFDRFGPSGNLYLRQRAGWWYVENQRSGLSDWGVRRRFKTRQEATEFRDEVAAVYWKKAPPVTLKRNRSDGRWVLTSNVGSGSTRSFHSRQTAVEHRDKLVEQLRQAGLPHDVEGYIGG